jgi:hypothetical protein
MRRAQPTSQCDVLNLLVDVTCSTYSSMRCAQPTSHDAQPTSPCDVLNLLGTMRNILDTVHNLLVNAMCSTY